MDNVQLTPNSQQQRRQQQQELRAITDQQRLREGICFSCEVLLFLLIRVSFTIVCVPLRYFKLQLVSYLSHGESMHVHSVSERPSLARKRKML